MPAYMLTNLNQLKKNVKPYAINITLETCLKVLMNFRLLIRACLNRCGADMEGGHLEKKFVAHRIIAM